MSSRDWVGLAALGLMLLTVVMVAPFGFKPDWSLVDAYAQWVMAAGAVATTLVSSAALIGIAYTYRQTKRSADIATESNDLNRQMLFASTRPFVQITHISVSRYRGEEGEENWWVNVRVENTSEFPAIDVAVSVEVKRRPLYIGSNKPVAALIEVFLSSETSRPTTVVLPKKFGEIVYSDVDDISEEGNYIGLMLIVALRYRSTLNPSFYATGAAYNVGSLADMFAFDSPPSQHETLVHYEGELIEATQLAT